MKRYTIVLSAGKTIEVDKAMADEVREVWKKKSQAIMNILGNTVSVFTIKGIFEKDVEPLQKTSLQDDPGQRMFEADCLLWSTKPIEEKVNRELNIRIYPNWLVLKKFIRDDPDVRKQITAVLYEFFTANPQYPRCPAQFWYPLLKPYLHKKVAKFYEVVWRNDTAVIKWARRNRIKMVTSFQIRT